MISKNLNMNADPKQIDVMILCGGRGTRLRPVISDRPKALAKIGNKPFLEILIDSITEQGFHNIILCVGYMKEQIQDNFRQDKEYNLIFSEEETPLGTGGAVKRALSLIKTDLFIVLNGDSISRIDFRDFIRFHINKKSFMSMALFRSTDAADFGSVRMDSNKRIIDFKEKATGEGFINAGIYIMNKNISSFMPEGNSFSLEDDVFPYIVKNNCYGYLLESEFIDIGTPERYRNAGQILKRILNKSEEKEN